VLDEKHTPRQRILGPGHLTADLGDAAIGSEASKEAPEIRPQRVDRISGERRAEMPGLDGGERLVERRESG